MATSFVGDGALGVPLACFFQHSQQERKNHAPAKI